MALIELEKITKEYRSDHVSFAAIREVSLLIEKGEFTALMGPSGSGKSTLMYIIGLLSRPTSGQYHLDGREVSKLSDLEQSKIRNENVGFIFQTFNLIPRISVLDNVILPLSYSQKNLGDRRKRAEEVLEQVGLAERMGYRPSQLSGGEQQRVAIARALANEPTILLADEPTGNLDSKTGQEILRLFQDLHRGGTTVLIVTHDESVAAAAQRIIKIKDGEIRNFELGGFHVG
jgi:putative ABC transport system ATP-binding protein